MHSYFFDLDGTLTDPRIGITRCIRYAIEKLKRTPPPEDQLVWCIGPPLLGSFEKILGERELAVTALKYYRERFADEGIYENRMYADIPDVLAALSDSGHRLYVATSKPEAYARQIVEHFGIERYFERVFGSELDGTRSDKTDLLSFALCETGVVPQQVTMIGDRSHDMIGARNNALSAVGVLYGYGSENELVAAGADRIAATTGDLLGVLIDLAD